MNNPNVPAILLDSFPQAFMLACVDSEVFKHALQSENPAWAAEHLRIFAEELFGDATPFLPMPKPKVCTCGADS